MLNVYKSILPKSLEAINAYRKFYLFDHDNAGALRNMCGRYYDAILFTLIVLFDEKGKGNVNTEGIKEILGSFHCSTKDAHSIIQCYLRKRKNAEVVAKKRNFDFSPSAMDSICAVVRVGTPKGKNILVTEEIKNEILLLSNTALTISEIIYAEKNRKNGCFLSDTTQISEPFRNWIKTKIEAFNVAFDLIPDERYWGLLFKYIPQYNYHSQIHMALRLFPKLDEQYINNRLQNPTSSILLRSLEYSFKEFEPLCKLANDLADLEVEEGHCRDFNQEKRASLLASMRVDELLDNLCLVNRLGKIAKLRPSDLRLIYRLLCSCNFDEIEFFFEEEIYPAVETQ